MTFITLNYHISATCHTILKINFRNFAISFVKKMLTLSQFSIKIKNYFSYKDPIPDDFKSFLVYTFTCARSSSSYIGETCRHFKTRIEEHIKNDNQSIFKHLRSIATCLDSQNSLSFKIIDKANSKFDLKIKDAIDINWKKPNLNAQQNHLPLTLSLQLPSPVFFFFAFLSSVIFIIFDTNYRHLLLSYLHFARKQKCNLEH